MRRLQTRASRSVSRGALYATLERLEKKGLVEWQIDATDVARSGHPRRHFSITAEGVRILRETRETLNSFWAAAETFLEESR